MRKLSFRNIIKSKTTTLFLVLIIILLGFSLLNSNYMTYLNMRNIMLATSLPGIIGVGVCCILISGNCDLSTGAVGCLGGLVCAYCLSIGIPWYLSLVITIVFGLLAGLINAVLLNVISIPPFIGTLAMTSVWTGIGSLLTKDVSIPINDKVLTTICGSSILGIPVPFVIMCVLMVIYGVVLSNTAFGRKIYMLGGNRQAARLAGINAKKLNYFLFMNCAAVSAFSGAIFDARMKTASTTAVQGTQFTAITALVLGGVAFGGGSGSMLGGFIGLLILNAFNNGLSVIGLDSYWQISAGGVLLIVALMIDYFNEKSRRKKMR